ncbi:uncharacterized protein LOC143276531 [Babylonia areolata]|uniref:uncharacterized protein LOC143276531 n=1 Tax=Babylonia areolata TaxID=304850 RepID=UPI003FD60364
MPIRARGELPDPCITAIRNCFTRPASTTINTADYIEITIDDPDSQIYFTTDGSRPAPFKRYIGSREVTFRYTAPFALKSGKRVVRAIGVSRDRLLESTVVSKTFVVRGDGDDTTDSDAYLEEERSEVYWDSDATDRSRSRRKWTACKSWTGGRNSRGQTRPTSAGPEWIASTRRYPYNLETADSDQEPERQSPLVQIPEGPFNPINYSGTQINVWGAPPGSVWPAAAAPATPTGLVTYGNQPPSAPLRPSVQHGLLTKQMIEDAEATDSSALDDSRPLTVAEARRIIAESEEAEASAMEQPEKKNKKKPGGGSRAGLSSGNVSFSGLARSGKTLLSASRSMKKK